MTFSNAGALLQRLMTAFPDRKFIVPSREEVGFIRVSARTQKIAAGSMIALLGVWCASLGSPGATPRADHGASNHRDAVAAAAQARDVKYRSELRDLTRDLARRQQFIEEMVQAHVGDLPAADTSTVDVSTTGTAASAGGGGAAPSPMVSLARPGADALHRIEAQQLAFVDRLTRYANQRANLASAEIRKLGLNPRVMMVAARDDAHAAMGGPLQKLSTENDGSVDPRFRRMGESLARLSALQDGLAALPQVSPAHVAYVSSSYGYRSDPFTGGAAFHAGLDFPGPIGSPIYAAAQGTVTFVGERSGYGNCIEVTHARGLMTRYGHLSGFRTHVGQKVEAGALIGAMGSTGRSTGSHLHFEVRVNGQPTNPRLFLQAARNAQQELS